MVGERIGILTPETTLNYTEQVNRENQLYNSTPVGQSKLRPLVEFATETAVYSAIPAIGCASRVGLIANGAVTGGLIGGLQFVEDGQVSSRFVNSGADAVLGTGVGVVADRFRGSMLKLYDLRAAKPRVTGQQQSTSSFHNATTYNAHVSMNKKLDALEKAQVRAIKTEELPGGRIRYYTKETFSIKTGPTRGSAYVTEYNPNTGQVRSWMECYDHSGNVNRVHPKMLDGQDLKAQHYPPTQSELKSFPKKSGGPQ
jgi:hypothetical protein